MTQPMPHLLPAPARAIALLMVLMTSLLLSACSVLPKPSPLRTFQLPDAPLATLSATQPATQSPARAAPLPITLRIDTPSANTLLDSMRILVQPDSEEIKIYAGSRWQDRAPVLIQDRLIAALRSDGRLNAVISSNSPANNSVLLSSTLTGFHSRYDDNNQNSGQNNGKGGIPAAVIELDAQLIDSGRGSVIATQRFTVSQEASDESIEAVVRAFGKAADQLDQQVVDWTLSRLSQHSVRP